MTTLRCKICGGSILLTGQTHGICDSCGTEVTLPQINDDKRAMLYDRANYFRQKCRFDEAREAFAHILADNRQDAELYWQLALCRYGIEYVQDSATGRHLPTCHIISDAPFLEDPDYQNALRYSDDYSRALYRKEAEILANIQAECLTVSRQQEPYDVFLCVRQSDEFGRELPDYQDAQALYKALTNKGMRVFLPGRTLAGVAAAKREPYIFAALNSARVMILVAGKLEHIKVPLVRNEWSRFLELREMDKTKSVVLAYRDVCLFDLPPQLNLAEKQDLSQITAYQDIAFGVEKLLNKSSAPPVQTPQRDKAANSQKVLQQRACRAVEDGFFSEAMIHCKQLLELDPENAWGHYYMLLAKNAVKDISELDSSRNWNEDRDFLRAKRHANGALQELLDHAQKQNEVRYAYYCGKEFYQAKKYESALRELEKCKDHADSAALIEVCRKKIKIKQAYESSVSQFNREVQSKGDYLHDQFLDRHADKWSRYEQLRSNVSKYYDTKLFRGWLYVAACTVMSLGALGLLAVYIHKGYVSSYGSWFEFACSSAWYGSTSCFLYIRLLKGKRDKNPMWILLLAFGLYFVYMALSSNMGIGLYLAMTLLGLIHLPVPLYRGIKKSKHKAALAKEREFVKTFLLPQHKQLITQLTEQYQSAMGQKALAPRLKKTVDAYRDKVFRETYLIPELYPILGYEVPENDCTEL